MTDRAEPTIVWEDPPGIHRSYGGRPLQWPSRLLPVRECPGVWAKVRTYPSPTSASSRASELRNGRVPGVDPAEWEFTSRATDDGGGAVYARFMGEAS